MSRTRLRRVLRAAVWASIGWNTRGLLDYLADRLGDTPPAQPTRRTP